MKRFVLCGLLALMGLSLAADVAEAGFLRRLFQRLRSRPAACARGCGGW